MSKVNIWFKKAASVFFALLFFAEGALILAYRKLWVFGKYSNNLYELDSPSFLLIALSSFSIAGVGVVSLFKPFDHQKTIAQAFFLSAFVLFTIGFFYNEFFG